MRTASLLPLAFTAALAVACGFETPVPPERDETASRPSAAPERDLTLQGPAATAREVASPVELARPEPPERPTRLARPRAKRRPAPPPRAELEPPPAAAPILVPLPPVAAAPIRPAAEAEAGGSSRELAPGKTVTAIPVSDEPGIEADAGDSWLPAERPRGMIRGGGGTCRQPRGGVRRNGITGLIPVGLPAPVLR